MAWSRPKKIAATVAALGAWELSWWAMRRARRGRVYECALARAKELGRPLVVVGAPDSGPTAGYGCGDITIDIGESSCPNFIKADITKPLPLADDSAVVFVACVLEYVDDYEAAMKELHRIAGENIYVIRVEPWTFVAWLYPGTRRHLTAAQSPTCERPMLRA